MKIDAWAANSLAFRFCPKLGGHEVIGRLAATGSVLVIPDAHNGEPVLGVGAWAFSDTQLSGVSIPNSVTSIGYGAFSFNMFTAIVIPDNVTSIGGSAFANNRLDNVTIGNGVTDIGPGAFANNQLASVTIPFASLSQADKAWGDGSWRSGIPDDVKWIFAPASNAGKK